MVPTGELIAPAVDDVADVGAADEAEDDYWYVGVCDDRGWQAEEEAEDQAARPAGQRQLCRPDNKAEARSVGKCAQQGVALVWDLHRQHRQHYQYAKDQSTDRSEHKP